MLAGQFGADGGALPAGPGDDVDAREQLARWLETAMRGYLQPCLRAPAEDVPWLPPSVDPAAFPEGASQPGSFQHCAP